MPHCASCNLDLIESDRRNVPSYINCCSRCWSKVPIPERLKLDIAYRDRSPGGVLNELADVLIRTIELQQQGD